MPSAGLLVMILAGVAATLLFYSQSASASSLSPTSSDPSSDGSGGQAASQGDVDYGAQVLTLRQDASPETASSPSQKASWLAWPETAAGGALSDLSFSGEAANLPFGEQAAILALASKYGVDPAAVAALRIAENGRPGREFGVLSVQTGGDPTKPPTDPGSTFYAQCTVACQSLKSQVQRQRAAGAETFDSAGRLTYEFWEAWQKRWAPIGAQNDPSGLNRNWLANAWGAYESSYAA